MNTDIRISVSFRNHRKRRKLRIILGENSTDYLLDLWISTAMNHPSGRLEGMDEVDIALDAGWEKEPTSFVEALMKCGFLEKDQDGTYFLHDWDDHQPESMRRYRYEQSGGYDENGNRLFPDGWQDIKAAVYRRDGRECQYCGANDGPFHIDHVIPRIKGGKDELDNLVVACASCNLSKGSKSVAEWLGVAG